MEGGSYYLPECAIKYGENGLQKIDLQKYIAADDKCHQSNSDVKLWGQVASDKAEKINREV